MYGIYANIWDILMVNVTIYSIHGSYGIWFMGSDPPNTSGNKGNQSGLPAKIIEFNPEIRNKKSGRGLLRTRWRPQIGRSKHACQQARVSSPSLIRTEVSHLGWFHIFASPTRLASTLFKISNRQRCFFLFIWRRADHNGKSWPSYRSYVVGHHHKYCGVFTCGSRSPESIDLGLTLPCTKPGGSGWCPANLVSLAYWLLWHIYLTKEKRTIMVYRYNSSIVCLRHIAKTTSPK